MMLPKFLLNALFPWVITPYWAFLIKLLIKELLLLFVPRLVVEIVELPLPIPQRVCSGPFPDRMLLMILLFEAPLGPPVTDCNQITALVVLVLVFVMVRSRVAVESGQIVFAVFPLLPSIVTQSAPLSIINADADVPEIEDVTPIAGLMVSVFTELAATLELMVIGKVSVG